VSGTNVYVGGLFSNIGGANRNNIAALDAATGRATAWNPDASINVGISSVNALAVSGTTVYVGGLFSSIGGANRNNIAALDATTGGATAWNPDANDAVFTLAVSGNIVYTGGNFTEINGQSRNFIARLHATSGSLFAWNPPLNGSVHALAVSQPTVYVGGFFCSCGSPRPGLVGFDFSPAPKIGLLGNGQFINDGDNTPSAADNTDFGNLAIGQTLTHTFTISNSGTVNLTLTSSPRVSITGAAASDFSVVSQATTPIGANATTTFQVRFSPSLSGTRAVSVTIASNDSDVNQYKFTLQGTGLTSLKKIYLPLITR
jgi:uncharacterized repeat protein (TIGR01451 family)